MQNKVSTNFNHKNTNMPLKCWSYFFRLAFSLTMSAMRKAQLLLLVKLISLNYIASLNHYQYNVLKCCAIDQIYDDVGNNCVRGPFRMESLMVHQNNQPSTEDLTDVDIQHNLENVTFVHKPLLSENCNGLGRK